MILKDIIFLFIFVSLSLGNCYGFLEIVVGAASYLYQKLCISGKCCTKNEIPADFQTLEHTLQSELFGQPLVQNTIISALKAHWNDKFTPAKALTMSFHGGPGVGKNYVSKFIQESLFRNGMRSPHVHNFIGRLEFPEESKTEWYKRNLANWIIGNVSNCPRQLFLFDEVNNMPPGVLDVIKPFIDYIDVVNGISYRETIFIFLSNTGASIVNDHVYKLYKRGIDRNDLELVDFENLIAQGAFNEKGGFQHSDTIKSNLIDHYIPFLPLMESHVRGCIVHEFKKRGLLNPSEKKIKAVLDHIDWAPSPEKLFAKTGCKRISQKVSLLVYSD